MASQGPNNPATTVDDNSYGATAWNSPNNSQSSNDVRATASELGGNITHYIKATNFGFTVTTGSTIDGIVVEVERNANLSTQADHVSDSRVSIVKADGTVGTTNKADGATRWPTTDAYVSYGTSADLWGLTWTAEDINDVDFGVAFAAVTSSSDVTAGVDHIRITVYYTAAAATTSTSSTSSSISTSTTISTSTSSTSTSLSTSSTSLSTSSTSSSLSTSSTSSSISTSYSSSTSTSTTTSTVMAIERNPQVSVQSVVPTGFVRRGR